MARRRFLVGEVRDGIAELRGEDARHLARVLRGEPGQTYEISDGAAVYLAEISAVEKDRVVFRAIERVNAPPRLVSLTIYPALIKFDRFEWMVEKATELGVGAIAPVVAARSEKGLSAAAVKRVERWRRIAHESSQQSRRVRPPEILEARPLPAVMDTSAGFRYFLDERRDAPRLLDALPPHEERQPSDSIALLCGPEGGWAEAEKDAAGAAGWRSVSLGPLILRAETAAIAAAALILHAW